MLHLISIFTRRSGNTTLVRFEPRKSLVCLLRRIRSMSHSASPKPLSQPWAAQPALTESQAPFFSEQTSAGSKLHIPTRSAGRLVKQRPQEIWRRSFGRFRYRTTKIIIFVSEALTFRAQAYIHHMVSSQCKWYLNSCLSYGNILRAFVGGEAKSLWKINHWATTCSQRWQLRGIFFINEQKKGLTQWLNSYISYYETEISQLWDRGFGRKSSCQSCLVYFHCA